MIWAISEIRYVTYCALKPGKSPLVLSQCPPNELDFGIEEFFNEQNGVIDAQIWGQIFLTRLRTWTCPLTSGNSCVPSSRTIRLEPWLRHGMPRNIQMTYLAFGLLVDKEPILIFNLIIWILNLMVLVVGIGTVRKNLSYVFSEICHMFWFWKKLVDKKFRFRRNILRQWTAK